MDEFLTSECERTSAGSGNRESQPMKIFKIYPSLDTVFISFKKRKNTVNANPMDGSLDALLSSRVTQNRIIITFLSAITQRCLPIDSRQGEVFIGT
jgi:hypothetical protein